MRADGSTFPVELTITRIDLPDQGGFAGYVRDITERKQAEAEMRASRARIVEAADEARRKLEHDLHDGAQQRLVELGLAAPHGAREDRREPDGGGGVPGRRRRRPDGSHRRAARAGAGDPPGGAHRGRAPAGAPGAGRAQQHPGQAHGRAGRGVSRPGSRRPSTSSSPRRSRTPPATRMRARSRCAPRSADGRLRVVITDDGRGEADLQGSGRARDRRSRRRRGRLAQRPQPGRGAARS